MLANTLITKLIDKFIGNMKKIFQNIWKNLISRANITKKVSTKHFLVKCCLKGLLKKIKLMIILGKVRLCKC